MSHLHYQYYKGDSPYEYQTWWQYPFYPAEEEPCARLGHVIVLPNDGGAVEINFDPQSVMTRRDFEKLVDYYEAKGTWPVHLIPDTPIKSGEPSLFLATM